MQPEETLPRPFVRWFYDGQWIGDTPYDAENDEATSPKVPGGIQVGGRLEFDLVDGEVK